MKQATALRQYFFYVDFKGFLHFEEEPHLFRKQNFSMATAIKDRRFLTQFYKNLQCVHPPIKYPRYPHLSQCWGQFNYVRSDIAPIIFNFLDKQQGQLYYSFQQSLKFDPKKLRVDNRGYIIYNFKPNINGVFGSDLVSQLAQDLTIQEGQTIFRYINEQIKLPKLEHQ